MAPKEQKQEGMSFGEVFAVPILRFTKHTKNNDTLAQRPFFQ